jgi:hypothetical protein
MTMMYSKFHMTIRIILLVAVVFFSTGFTSVVKYCSMSHSSECCCEADHSDDSATQPVKQVAVGKNCVTVKVVGGLSDTKATVNSETFSKSLAITVNASVLVENSLLTPTHSFTHSFTNDLPPPQGDICIRISSFLI